MGGDKIVLHCSRLVDKITNSETKAKTKTETKIYETETSMINSIARESKTNHYALLSITHMS